MTMLEKENAVKRFVWTVAVAIPVAVALLFFIPPAENLSEETRQALYVLPQINAWFNGTAFFCLIGALIAIKNKNVPLHRAFNTVALSLSVLFLFSYVAFHLTTESTHYGGEGWQRTVYFTILISHIVLSTGIIPVGSVYVLSWTAHGSRSPPEIGTHHMAHLAVRHRNRCAGLLDDLPLLPHWMNARNLLFKSLIVAGLILMLPGLMEGQCVMCKAVAEDSAADGGLGAGLNRGILYLMGIPYVLLSALFFVIYRSWKSDSAA